IFDAIVGNALQADVRCGAEKALLQVLAESVVDGEGDDQRGDSGSDSRDRDAGDDADERLTPFGAQVASRDEEFEAHRAFSCQPSAISFQANRIIAGTCSLR